jgi:AAA+ superfamily predicted ATPase
MDGDGSKPKYDSMDIGYVNRERAEVDADTVKDLMLIVRSRVPIVVIESHEENMVMALITGIAQKIGLPAFFWTVTDGLVHQGNLDLKIKTPKFTKPEKVLNEIKNRSTPGVYVLIDFHPYLKENHRVERLLKEIAMGYEYLNHTVILLSYRIDLPDTLKPFTARFDLPVPDAKKLETIVMEEVRRWCRPARQSIQVSPRVLKKMTRNLLGLTLTDARRLARKAICDDNVITESDIARVNKAKYELLDMDGLLSFEFETAHFSDVGDLNNLKTWLRLRKEVFISELGLQKSDMPKGIMLVGVQGAGKSLAAKAVAGAWGVPLLRLDFAILYNKYFGETEKNLRKALKMADMMAPCVLWIDEIEKGIATGDYDSGTSRRVLGTFLTWMSERKKPVFIVATSNDIASLPPEMIRKGRLDEIFFVDLPDQIAREEIFKIHLSKRGIALKGVDIAKASELTDGFSGAEIEQVVVSAVYLARTSRQNFCTEHLVEEIHRTRPLSVVMSEKIHALRQWSKGRTVRAN